MKNLFKKLTAALAASMVLVMLIGSSVFASSTAENPHFDFACGSQFTMHPGEARDINWFCDQDYCVYMTENNSSKSGIAFSGKAGNNTGTIYIGADETSRHVVFYFYPNDDDDNYDTLIVDVAPNNFTTSAVSQLPSFTGSAQAADGTHTVIYDAQGHAMAAFAILGNNGFAQVSLGGFTQTANGIYLTVNTPLDKNASTISMPQADEAAARALGINGIILNNQTVNWP